VISIIYSSIMREFHISHHDSPDWNSTVFHRSNRIVFCIFFFFVFIICFTWRISGAGILGLYSYFFSSPL
jgi:hypothetical protein